MNRICAHCKIKCEHAKFKPVTHVIFDLDGVIIDTEDAYREAFRKTIEDYGHQFEFEFYQQISGATSPNVAKLNIAHYNLDVSPDDFIKKYRGYAKAGFEELELLPGAENIIRHLYRNGIPMAIATSSAKESVLKKTEKFRELIELFSHIVYGDDPEVKGGKPKPDSYLVCASRFVDKPSPSKCLVFEDSPNGVKSAIAAGMQVVMIPNESASHESWNMATLKINSLSEMSPELFGLPAFGYEVEQSVSK